MILIIASCYPHRSISQHLMGGFLTIFLLTSHCYPYGCLIFPS